MLDNYPAEGEDDYIPPKAKSKGRGRTIGPAKDKTSNKKKSNKKVINVRCATTVGTKEKRITLRNCC